MATQPDRPRLLARLGAELIVADAQPILLRVPAAAFQKLPTRGPLRRVRAPHDRKNHGSASTPLLRTSTRILPADRHLRAVAPRAQVPALLKGLIFGPNGRAMSLSHTRRRGRIYRYYVTREAITNGYDSCAVTSVPAADVEGALLAQVQNVLAAPGLVARTWAAAKRQGEDEITERDVTVLLADFATV
jgi:hypothetical protein